MMYPALSRQRPHGFVFAFTGGAKNHLLVITIFYIKCELVQMTTLYVLYVEG